VFASLHSTNHLDGQSIPQKSFKKQLSASSLKEWFIGLSTGVDDIECTLAVLPATAA
jgi:hypothetical protein